MLEDLNVSSASLIHAFSLTPPHNVVAALEVAKIVVVVVVVVWAKRFVYDV